MRYLRRGTACISILTALAGCGDLPPADAQQSTPEEATFRGQVVRGYDRAMPDVDALGYDVDLRMDESTPGEERYRATLVGTFVATRPLTALTLDLEGNTVESVDVDRRATTWSHDGQRLTVNLPRELTAGRAVTVTVRYRGAAFQGTGVNSSDLARFGGLMVFQTNRAGRKIFASLNWPSKARRWMPLRDHPADGAMFALRATFPSRYVVMANGVGTAPVEQPDGTRAWQFVARTPMPTYDFHLAAYDDWVEVPARAPSNGAAMRYYSYSGDRAQAEPLYTDLPAAMEYYSDTFGPFRWEGVSFLEVPIFGGAMEHATLVSMDETLFRNGRTNRTVSFHELAHHWSGNLARIGTWNDFWLSEGVTDYLTRRFVTAHDGESAGRTLWRETLRRAIAADDARNHPLRPAITEGAPEVDVLTIFDDVSYKKGAWVLRMLEREVGPEALTAFLRGWFERHRFAPVTTDDISRELSSEVGRDLSPFFQQWVYGVGYPLLRVTTRYDRASASAEVTVEQTQTRGPSQGFTFPLDVELTRGEERARVTVQVRGARATATVPVTFEPTGFTADPDERLYFSLACTADTPCREGYACTRGGCVPR